MEENSMYTVTWRHDMKYTLKNNVTDPTGIIKYRADSQKKTGLLAIFQIW
jgi:hypothetical protein